MTALKADRLDGLFGKSLAEVQAALPSGRLSEPSDIRPYLTTVMADLFEKDKAGKPMRLEVSLLEGAVFQVSIRLGSYSKDIKKEVATTLGRPHDRQSVEDWKVATYSWDEGNVTIKMREKGKLRAIVVADRARHEAFLEVDTKPYAAWLANERGIQAHMKHPTDVHAAVEGYRQAVDLVPEMGHAWVNLCHLHYEEQSFGLAREECTKAREVTKTPSVLAEVALYEGLMLVRDGLRGDGIAKLTEAVSTRANDDYAIKKAQRHIDLLTGKRKRADLDKAMEEALCAERDGDPGKSSLILASYGFNSMDDLTTAADSAGVDSIGVEMRVSNRCHP